MRALVLGSFVSLVALACGGSSSGSSAAGGPTAGTCGEACKYSCAARCSQTLAQCEVACDSSTPMEQGNTAKQGYVPREGNADCRRICQGQDQTCHRTCNAECKPCS